MGCCAHFFALDTVNNAFVVKMVLTHPTPHPGKSLTLVRAAPAAERAYCPISKHHYNVWSTLNLSRPPVHPLISLLRKFRCHKTTAMAGLQLHQPRVPLVCKAGRPLPVSKRAQAAFHLQVQTKQPIPALNACLVLQSVLTADSPCKFSAPNSM